MMSPDTFRTVMLGSAAVAQTLFVICYFTFPWYRDLMGRVLFGNALMLAVVMDSFILSRVLGVGTNDWLFIGLYFLLSLFMWSQLGVFAWMRATHHRNADKSVSRNDES